MTGIVADHDLLAEQLMVTLSTDVAHIVTESGESACGQFEYDLDEIERDDDGHVFYQCRYFGHHGLIHEDDTWSPHYKSLCHYCDAEVPDELQAQLFTDDKFEYVSELTDGS